MKQTLSLVGIAVVCIFVPAIAVVTVVGIVALLLWTKYQGLKLARECKQASEAYDAELQRATQEVDRQSKEQANKKMAELILKDMRRA